MSYVVIGLLILLIHQQELIGYTQRG